MQLRSESNLLSECCMPAELENIKKAEPGQFFSFVYTLQLFISLRWQRTYGQPA